VSEARANPIDDWISFPEAIVISRQEVLPSESIGWGLNLVLVLPPRIAFEHVKAQLATAGFHEESSGVGSSLFRLVRDDAYVWGSVTDAGGGASRVFLSCSTAVEPGPN
jgi:hypothetical protein